MFASLLLLSFASISVAQFVDTHPGLKGSTPGTCEMTYYTPGEAQFAGKQDACGELHTTSDFILAVAHEYFDSYGPSSTSHPLCGKNVKINYGGKSVVATISDRCADCELPYNIDLTPAAMKVLVPDYIKVGRVYEGITWDFTDEPVGAAGSGSDAVVTDAASPTQDSHVEVEELELSATVTAKGALATSTEDDETDFLDTEDLDATVTTKDATPSATVSQTGTGGTHGFDDGMYHPPPQYDDGMWRGRSKRSFKARLSNIQ